MQRKQFTFYESFRDTLETIPMRHQLAFLKALINYALDGTEPDNLGKTAAATGFCAIKPVLASACKKAGNAQFGGAQARGKSKQTDACSLNSDELEGDRDRDLDRAPARDRQTRQTACEAAAFSAGSTPEEDGAPSEAGRSVSRSVAGGVVIDFPVRPEPCGTLPGEGSTPGDNRYAIELAAKALGGLSLTARSELGGFLRTMGSDCVLRAVGAAQDVGKPTWAYVRGILRRKLEQGVCSAADWDRQEAAHARRAAGLAPRRRGPDTIAGTPRNVQPAPGRAQKDGDWLDDFLQKPVHTSREATA